jgi:hypothetical protein
MDKGAFKGKSLSSIKPKTEHLEAVPEVGSEPLPKATPEVKPAKQKPNPSADLTTDIEGTPAEVAAARLEKVISLVLANTSLDDRKKEGIIYDVLNRKPKEVKFEVLQQMPAIMKRLERNNPCSIPGAVPRT